MDAALGKLIRDRAGDRCEYCRLPQAAVDATFHVDHVLAQQHTDETEETPERLALACDRCNFCKGTNLSSIDPVTRQIVLLFNPRQDVLATSGLERNSTAAGEASRICSAVGDMNHETHETHETHERNERNERNDSVDGE